MTGRSILFLTTPEELAPYTPTLLYAGFDPVSIAAQRADAHLVLLDDDEPLGRCSLWWTDEPQLEGETVGVIGHYAAAGVADEASAGPDLDPTASLELLDAACAHLAAHGCSLAVGPMDGNTWRNYRFVTDRGGEPAFFLEPDNPEAYPHQWSCAGFGPLAEYFSALDCDLTRRDPRLPAAAERLTAAGVTIRPLDPNDIDAELARVYQVSLASFRRNFLYTPLPEDEFRAQYKAVLPYAQPELTLIAEDAGQPVGFIFGVPDVSQKLRGGEIDTVIVKTVAVLPGRRLAGLGALLVERVQLAAAELGFSRAIHALMFESNSSRSISAHYATTMRRYALYSKRLGE